MGATATERMLSLALRLCETPPSPPAPDSVGIKNCEQLFSPLLAFTTRNEKKLFTVFDTDRGISHALKAKCYRPILKYL